MNPFIDEETQNDTNELQNSEINIWIITNGRKKNTYISGWLIPDTEIKEHLKIIKKKNGCNGTLKTLEDLDTDKDIKETKVVQLQGDHVQFMVEYLIANDIDKSNIKIKG
jgi:translation initiation factor 1 (eIF-1/SUI1)